MINTKENFNQLDTTLAVQELDDEVAASCSGGAALTLYENGRFNNPKDGRVLPLNKSVRNLGSFNDLTSSFIISSGRWTFYADEQHTKPLFTLGRGSYPVLSTGKNGANDRISSVKRIA